MQSYLTSRDLLFNLEATNSSEAKRKWKQSIKDKWDYKCAYCGSDENLTLDHIISKSRADIIKSLTYYVHVKTAIKIRQINCGPNGF